MTACGSSSPAAPAALSPEAQVAPMLREVCGLTAEEIARAFLVSPPIGLLALMLLQESRRETLTTTEGDLVLLDEQDRSRWSQAPITEGTALVEHVLVSGRAGPYALQAAIAAVHAEAPTAAATDWAQIVAPYDLLLRLESSPVVS